MTFTSKKNQNSKLWSIYRRIIFSRTPVLNNNSGEITVATWDRISLKFYSCKHSSVSSLELFGNLKTCIFQT